LQKKVTTPFEGRKQVSGIRKFSSLIGREGGSKKKLHGLRRGGGPEPWKYEKNEFRDATKGRGPSDHLESKRVKGSKGNEESHAAGVRRGLRKTKFLSTRSRTIRGGDACSKGGQKNCGPDLANEWTLKSIVRTNGLGNQKFSDDYWFDRGTVLNSELRLCDLQSESPGGRCGGNCFVERRD